MKKRFLIFIFILILIVGIIALVKYNKHKKSLIYSVEQIKNEDYFLLMENDRYGVINKEGQVLVDPIYDIVEIPNPTKAVFVCKNNYNIETKNYNVQVFDDSHNQILYQYYIVEPIKLNNVEKNGYYEKSTLKYMSNNKYGLIDFQGNKITDAIYDSIEGFEYKEGILLVKKDGKYGLININGATIVKEEYDEIVSDAFYTNNSKYQKSGYIVGKKTENGMRYGYISYDGKILLKNEFNEIYRIIEKNEEDNAYLIAFENGRAGVYKDNKKIIDNQYEDIFYNATGDLLILKKNSKQGVSKFDGTEIIPIEYDNIFFTGKYINAQKSGNTEIFSIDGKKDFPSNYTSIQDVQDGKYTIISTSDNEYKILTQDKTIEDGYSYIQYLFNDYFFVCKNQKNGIINSEGEIVLDIKYGVIQRISTYNMVQVIDQEKNIIILNSSLQEVAKEKGANIYLSDDYIIFKFENDIKYFDKNGNELSNSDLFKDNKLIAYKKNSKWGYKNQNGEEVVQAEYDYVTELNKYGYAGIKLKGKWGVINKEGKIIKEPSYEIDSTTDPSFIGEFYKVDLGYGIPYYTK